MGGNKSKPKNSDSSFTEFTEGYWASDQDPSKDIYKGEYPWPQSSSFPEKEEFMIKLTKVEEYLKLKEETKIKDEEDYVISYRGLSRCRICNEKNGYKEYVFKFSKNGKVNWPEGFRHYVEAHEIRPSDKFVEIIMDAEIN